MDLGLEGRVALVTGGSQGMGLAIAAALVNEGARVAIASRSRERIDRAAAEIGATGFVMDSADLGGIPQLIEKIEASLGPIEIYVANTGGPPGNDDPLGFSPEQWEDAHRTLVMSPMVFLEHLLPKMRERGWGRVVGISSTSVLAPSPRLQLSNVHRPGLINGFKVLARQEAKNGITINSILPGRIATARAFEAFASPAEAEAQAAKEVPIGRLGTVEEIASATVFLCSTQASYITGTTLLVDGGLMQSV
jgi:3-oxoacyl-[acyl-carrier protein] reductase